MKPFLLGLLLIPVLSQASVVKLEFDGSIDTITYASCTAFDAGSCSAWSFTHPSISHAYNGIPLGIGNEFSGSFSYDTAVNYSLSSDGYQAVYLNGVVDAGLSLKSVTLPSPSMPSIIGQGSYSVVNNRYDRDLLMLQQLFQKNDWFVIMSLFLHDSSGQLYSSFAAPTTIDSKQYSSAQLQLTFLQRSTGDQLQLYSNLEQYGTVSSSEVPEPATLLLSLGGLAALITQRRRDAFR